MTDILLESVPIARDTLLIAFLVFLRVGAAMAAVPGFGEQMVPLRVRLGATLAFSIIVAPAARGHFLPVLSQPVVLVAAIEVAAGLIIGIVLRLFVHALQIAGSIAAQSVSLSQLLGATSADPVPALGQVLVMGGICLALILGLHVRLVEYFLLSYDLIIPGRIPGAAEFANWGVDRVATSFALAFSLAAPFVIASTIYNLALGVINRAMPQLMVAFVGAPAITAGGLVVLFLATPLILMSWVGLLTEFMNAPVGGL